MKKRKTEKFLNLCVCTVLAMTVAVTGLYVFTDIFVTESAEAGAGYGQGSTGEPVLQIQKALQERGYYTGKLDGIYGKLTTAAVKKFQTDTGLRVDGIVGSGTVAALGVTFQAKSGTGDLDLLARVIYGEARGEAYVGQVAVGAVVLNRVASSLFPNTVSGVVYQAGAFDAVSDGQVNLTPDDTAKRAAQDALNGWDPTGGCLYYYNPKTATSKWMLSKTVYLSIGNHSFCL